VSSRWRTRSPHRQPIWLRIVAGFVLAVVTSLSTIAWALPCCGHGDPCDDEPTVAAHTDLHDGEAAAHDGDEASHDGEVASTGQDEDGSEEEPCSCPPECGPCCGAMPPPGLVPLVVPLISHLPPWIDLGLPEVPQSAPDGAEGDVLHVPIQGDRTSRM
jgi:hypothetical protein